MFDQRSSCTDNITLIMAPSVFLALQCIPSNQGFYATGESALHPVLQDDIPGFDAIGERALHCILQDDIPTCSSVMQVCRDKAGGIWHSTAMALTYVGLLCTQVSVA